VYLFCHCFVLTDLRNFTGGTCLWESWARGQETIRNPGARESDRLFLAGWEVNQFGQSFSLDRASEQHQFEVDMFYYHHYYVDVHYLYIVHNNYAEYVVYYHAAHF
jgi:hypothetical protein